jgi:NAD(P)-dependent dehydrogenase (short-subunit alcohol dehydrogenase family)
MTEHPLLDELFALDGRVAVVTGATGAIGSALALALGRAGAGVALLARRAAPLDRQAAILRAEGIDALAVSADVRSLRDLEAARGQVLERFGRADILVNAAGGNVAEAILGDDDNLTDLSAEGLREVVDLNLMGTWLPCQAFAPALTAPRHADGTRSEGAILNVSSMAAQRPLTRVGGYGAAKAAVENLTRWLAVELARRHGDGVRVNAIAPGFFLGEQNRGLLLDEHDQPTSRGQAILAHTPARRFGAARDLEGAAIWLCSPAARFVTGVVVPVDGGFSAASGV